MPESLLFAAIPLVQGKSDEHVSSFFPPRFFPTLMVRADHYSFFSFFFYLLLRHKLYYEREPVSSYLRPSNVVRLVP